MFWTSSAGRIELIITKRQAGKGHHQGQCLPDILELLKDRSISYQLNKIKPEVLKQELDEYGGWEDEELNHHAKNLERILWLACGDLQEEDDWEDEEPRLDSYSSLHPKLLNEIITNNSLNDEQWEQLCQVMNLRSDELSEIFYQAQIKHENNLFNLTSN